MKVFQFHSDSEKNHEKPTTRIKPTIKPIVISPNEYDEKRGYAHQNMEPDFWKTRAEETARQHDSERQLYQETFIENNKLKQEVARLDRWVVHLQDANEQAAQDLIKNLDTIDELKIEWEEACKNLCHVSAHRELVTENEVLQKRVKELQKVITDYNKSRRISEQQQQQKNAENKSRLANHKNNKNNSYSLEQLKIDIENLAIALRKTTSLQNSGFVINEEAAKQLLDQYDVKYYPGEHLPRNLISAALQRRIIETVLNGMNTHFNYSVRSNDNSAIDWSTQLLRRKSRSKDHSKSSKKENGIDRQIVSTMEILAEQFTVFSKTNPDAKLLSDDSKIQLRQLIFNLLGSRTFETSDSLIIDSICAEILEGLEEIRTIPSSKQRVLLKKQDEQTIRQCISTLFFKLAAQHPKLHIEWLQKRTPVDESIMDLTWIDDDESIEICSFPLIKVTETGEIVFKAHVEASSEGTKCGDDNKVAETKSIITGVSQFTEEPVSIKPTTEAPKKKKEPVHVAKIIIPKTTSKTTIPKSSLTSSMTTSKKESVHVAKIIKPKTTSKTIIPKSSSTPSITTKPTTPTVPRKAADSSSSRRQSTYMGSLASWATSYVPPVVQTTVQTNITKIVPTSVQSKFDQYLPMHSENLAWIYQCDLHTRINIADNQRICVS
ncbi:13239_t:CDS:2 [Ambispora gerdemannii]|uniref:13239_t:CDS:1 n=1 Tax=Ambispora gerdemannii TaxID=144530 RepID=A0A9N9AW08_9GLOM|nr:13239_t:CDS:2 [Ambispora gerdemannii]